MALPIACEDISFIPFRPPPSTVSSGWGRWVESLEAIDYDLSYLLKLSHLKFWTQVIRDKSLSTLLDTYLQHCIRPYEEVWSVPENVMELLRNIHRRIFMVFLRMSTHKEVSQFTSDGFSDLIHTYSLFTVPRIIDLCCIYGNSNGELLCKMIDNIMTKQPLYAHELQHVLHTDICTALDSLHHKTTENMSLKDIVDIVLYYADVTHCIVSLLSVTPNCAIWNNTGLIDKLVNCYELIVPTLQSHWKGVQYSYDNHCYITKCLRTAKYNTASIVQQVLSICCHSDSRMDQILTFLNSITSAKMFIKEFEKHFSVKEYCHLLKTSHPKLDDVQLQYILTAVYGKQDPPPKTTPIRSAPNVKEMVCYIKEMLPHLGDEFIINCLKEFHYNQEVVIHHILEGTLPPHLQPDEAMPTINEGTPTTNETALTIDEGQSLLEERVGVYDYDEFDLLRRKDVDLSKVHVGKRDESLSDILTDRSHVEHMKWSGLIYDEYSDEYDDTYDSHTIGALDDDIKRLNIKGQYSSRGHRWVGVASSDDSESDEERVKVTEPVQLLQRPKTPDNVKTNEQERKQDVKPDSKKKTTGSRRGKEREEGDTDRQRSYNERHKGSRANHNRRKLANKKRGATGFQ